MRRKIMDTAAFVKAGLRRWTRRRPYQEKPIAMLGQGQRCCDDLRPVQGRDRVTCSFTAVCAAARQFAVYIKKWTVHPRSVTTEPCAGSANRNEIEILHAHRR